MYILYKTDKHHSKADRELLGVCKTIRDVIKMCKEVADLEEEIFTEDDVRSISDLSQTQGYSGCGEFLAIEVELNKLYEN